nr:hypothetical protein [Tanacetum cinerariifolium]
NKVDLDTMSMDDLYNNLKMYESEVKGMSISNSNIQNMDFLSSTNSNTNGSVNTAQAVNTPNGVSTASTQVHAAFSINSNNLSDAVICAFLTSQSNSPQLAHENLEQIHPDDMEEIDLRWQMAIAFDRFMYTSSDYRINALSFKLHGLKPSPPPLLHTTAGTTATAAAFPAVAVAVTGCRGCPPPNHHRGGGQTTVQPPHVHLVVSGYDGATSRNASGIETIQQKGRESFSQLKLKRNELTPQQMCFLLFRIETIRQKGDGEDECCVFEVNVTGSGSLGVWVDVSIGSEVVSRLWVKLFNRSCSSFSSFSKENACSLKEATCYLREASCSIFCCN